MTDFTGDSGDNTLAGTSGDDLILGLAGNDNLSGLGGNDVLAGGSGSNVLTGGTGLDVFRMDTRLSHEDIITDFTVGTDRIDISILNVADLITLSPYIRQVGSDVYIETFWDDFDGGSPNEVIILENISLAALTEADFIFNISDAAITQSADNDTDHVMFGGNGNDTLTGRRGDDQLNGGAGDDVLAAGYGYNLIRGGIGADIFVSSDRGNAEQVIADFSQLDSDRIDVSALNVADLETLSPFIQQVGNDVHIATFWGGSDNAFPGELIVIENVDLADLTDSDFIFNTDTASVTTTLNSTLNYALFGGDGDDILTQLGSGDDALNGGGGNDTLSAGRGSNSLRGGTGSDVFVMTERGIQTQNIEDFSVAETDRIDLRALNVADLETLTPYLRQIGNDVHIETFWRDSSGAESPNEVIILENTVLETLTSANFIFNGDTAAIDIELNSGLDHVLFGGDGDDTLIQLGDSQNELNGGAGNDTLTTGDGGDIIRGGAGDDTIRSGSGNDEQFGGDGNDIMNGFGGNDIMEGGNGRDRLDGGDGDDILSGGDLNDLLIGAGGNDRMGGGDFTDRLYGGDGRDIMSGQNGNDKMHGGGGNDVMLGGEGNDLMNGGANGDLLFGGDNFDTILGGTGIDFIDGGASNDTLWGGSGNGFDGAMDTFFFANSHGTDRIMDFENGIDVIDFSEHSNYNSFSDVLARAGDDGTNLTIHINNSNSLIIENFTLAEMDASDFIF